MEIIYKIIASSEKIDAGSIGLNNPVTDADKALAGLLNSIYGVAGMICVIMIVIAGIYYVVSMGDSGKVKRAKDAILGAAIGLIIISMAFVITQFILGGMK